MGGELGGRNHSGTQEEIREFSASLVQLSLVVRAHTHTHTSLPAPGTHMDKSSLLMIHFSERSSLVCCAGT